MIFHNSWHPKVSNFLQYHHPTLGKPCRKLKLRQPSQAHSCALWTCRLCTLGTLGCSETGTAKGCGGTGKSRIAMTRESWQNWRPCMGHAWRSGWGLPFWDFWISWIKSLANSWTYYICKVQNMIKSIGWQGNRSASQLQCPHIGFPARRAATQHKCHPASPGFSWGRNRPRGLDRHPANTAPSQLVPWSPWGPGFSN